MDEFFGLLARLNTYLWILPILVGLFQWKRLSVPFKVYVLGSACSVLVVYTCMYLGLRNVAFYAMPLLGSMVFGLIFQRLLAGIVNPKLIPALILLIWAVVIGYIIRYSIYDFQLRVNIPYDVIMLGLSATYLTYRLNHSATISDPLFYLVLIFLVDFSVNLFLDLISNSLKTYLSDSFMKMLWGEILPIYNFIKILALSATILAVKPSLPRLDQMPSFNN